MSINNVMDLWCEHEYDLDDIVGKDHTYVEGEGDDTVRWDFGSQSLWICSIKDKWNTYGMKLTTAQQKKLNILVGAKIEFN